MLLRIYFDEYPFSKRKFNNDYYYCTLTLNKLNKITNNIGTKLLNKYKGYNICNFYTEEKIVLPKEIVMFFKLQNKVIECKEADKDNYLIRYNIIIDDIELYAALILGEITLKEYMLIQKYVFNFYKENVHFHHWYESNIIYFDDMDNAKKFTEFIYKEYKLYCIVEDKICEIYM